MNLQMQEEGLHLIHRSVGGHLRYEYLWLYIFMMLSFLKEPFVIIVFKHFFCFSEMKYSGSNNIHQRSMLINVLLDCIGRIMCATYNFWIARREKCDTGKLTENWSVVFCYWKGTEINLPENTSSIWFMIYYITI